MKRIITAILGTLLLPSVSVADHSWNDYHWARTSASFNLILVNNTTPDWQPYVVQAISDWSLSPMVVLVEDSSGANNTKVRRRCSSIEGQLRICNLAYGNTGWLGIAGISLDGNGHITTGYTKLNDTYFSDPYYDEAWKQSVTCQEIGHNLGLDHQDEDFNNQSLFSCMDYQNPPFEYPNTHDFEQLTSIYGHLDSYNSYAGAGENPDPRACNAPPGKGCNKAGSNNDVGWGMSMGRRGNAEKFLRIDRNGVRHLTHVTWAIGF
jgi:predicted Zn-dependent protease